MNRIGTGAAVALVMAASACGSDSPNAPTPLPKLTQSFTLEGPIAAGRTGCTDFRVGYEGPVAVELTPATFPIELMSGSCAEPPVSIIRAGAGTVTATMPLGPSRVRYVNTTDRDTSFRLSVTYPY